LVNLQRKLELLKRAAKPVLKYVLSIRRSEGTLVYKEESKEPRQRQGAAQLKSLMSVVAHKLNKYNKQVDYYPEIFVVHTASVFFFNPEVNCYLNIRLSAANLAHYGGVERWSRNTKDD